MYEYILIKAKYNEYLTYLNQIKIHSNRNLGKTVT